MTQKNIETMDIIVNKITEGKKLSRALREVYVKRNVAIPFNDSMFNVELLALDVSMRAYNGFMRAGLRTVKDIVDYSQKNSLIRISGLGRTSIIEVMEIILNLAWDKMSANARTEFLIDVVMRNENNLREEII